jgi:hypothetical protein
MDDRASKSATWYGEGWASANLAPCLPNSSIGLWEGLLRETGYSKERKKPDTKAQGAVDHG